ncbi:MAG: hypothetical protein ABSF60_11180 [Verrucomicrobiota bacterium]|jgi:hypothetical protein
MKKQLSLLLSLASAALLLTGCATTLPQPLHSAAGFQPESMDAVYILPVVDARADKKLSLNLGGLQRNMASSLQQKRYKVVVLEDTNLVAGITDEDLKEPTPDWVKGIGPSESRWVMALAVGELSRKITFGSTGNAEVNLFIFDKQTGTLVWEDKGLGRAGQGGLLGMMMVSMMDEAAIENAMNQVMVKFPKKPKGT